MIKNLFNKNKKTEQHLIEIKIILLILVLMSVLNIITICSNRHSYKNRKNNTKYVKSTSQNTEDLINKTVCLWNGRKNPCKEIKYFNREEIDDFNKYQNKELTKEQIERLNKYNAKIVLYKSEDNKLLGISCPSLSINKKGKEKFMVLDFVDNNLDKLIKKSNNKENIACPPVIK